MTDAFSLKGRCALVTGGSRGIGEAICLSLAGAGADVAVMSRKPQNCEPVAGKLRGMGVRSIAIGAHAGKAEDCARAVDETVKAFGKLDILVNNAAVSPAFGPSIFCSDDAFDKLVAVNIKGPFMLTKLAAPHMEAAGGGAIINIASTAGFVPAPMIGMYSVTKAAVIHMTKMFAKELGINGIRVNCVAPGLVRTEFSRAIWDNEEVLNQYLQQKPIQKLTEPKDIAGAVVYLASGASAMVTGTVVVVDGGELVS
jgi:NAD(P)-dependent dehydrogenase (short-subunit alcohol dehydrogenase family)